MLKLSKLVKFLRDPHTERIQQLKDRYQELDDLSNVAVEIGNAAVYMSLQTELKEVFFDYLSAIVIDSVYKLVPHILIIWVISLKWQSVNIPFVNWQVNILAAYLLSYLLYNLGPILINPIRVKLSKSGSSGVLGRFVTNKI